MTNLNEYNILLHWLMKKNFSRVKCNRFKLKKGKLNT